MSNSAKYIRIFNPAPDDEYVTKRTAAIKTITEKFKKLKTIEELMGLSDELCGAFLNDKGLSDYLVEHVGKALRDQSASFVVEGQELQMATCSLISVLDYLSKITNVTGPLNITISDVIAVSLFSGLTFMSPDLARPKFDELRLDIIQECERICGMSSTAARDRVQIKEMLTISEGADFVTNNKNIVATISPILKALTTNATLDREEINILWYILDGTSFILKSHASDLNGPQTAIVSGLEISTLLRLLPTEAHFLIAQRSLRDEIDTDASEFLNELGAILPTIAAFLSDFSIIKSYPNIFPLFNMILDSNANCAGGEIKRSLKTWTNRALVEGSLLNLSKFLNDGK